MPAKKRNTRKTQARKKPAAKKPAARKKSATAKKSTARRSDKKAIEAQLQRLIDDARNLTADVSGQVEEILKKGVAKPLTRAQARRLLTEVVGVVSRHAEDLGDNETVASLTEEDFVGKVMDAREKLAGGASANSAGSGKRKPRVRLKKHNGIPPGPVFPTPTFHRHEVPMMSGFVKLNEIQLWGENERLDVHVNQFREENGGRAPTGEEVLTIMLTQMPLQGVAKEDEFKITDLARSIANNGVRRPPVIDLDGTLRDGNRRVAACNYILSSDAFTAEQRKRAEWLFVWQLTEHATDEDRELVMVSLNFEPDHKQEWPTYVKARKVWDEWQRLLALEPRAPARARQLDLLRQVADDFALGPGLTQTQRYIRMVAWANDFEEHQVTVRKRDEYEVKHRAAQKFEYFDELSKGANPGGVAHTLGQDEKLKELAFDLLFQNKFKKFSQIRLLKHLPSNPEMVKALRKARSEKDVETGREQVEDTLVELQAQRAEKRKLGANARIEAFCEWLEQVPLAAPRDNITDENLEKLLSALKLVREQAAPILGKKRVNELLRD